MMKESKNQIDLLIKPTKGLDDLLPARGVEVPSFTLKSTTRLILVMLLIVISLTGNSTICFLMKKFKMIRTIPNMFLANLAIVDILSVLTNMPFLIIVGVFELNQTLSGREVSFLIALTQNFFNILKIVSILATMTDRFIAIAWELKYYVWKTKIKAAKAICAAWLVSIAIVLSWMMCSSSQIDLGDIDGPAVYRVVYFDKYGKHATFFVFLIFGLVSTVLSMMTCFSIKRKAKDYAEQGKAPAHSRINQANTKLVEARNRNDVQAMCTVGLTTATYVIAYAPCILYTVFIDNREDMTSSSEVEWFGFAANYFLFVSSACNPFIYLTRSHRFRRAITDLFLKKLLKTTPCGAKNLQVGPAKMELTSCAFNKKVRRKSSVKPDN